MQMSAYANEPAITSLNDAAEFVGKRKKRRLVRWRYVNGRTEATCLLRRFIWKSIKRDWKRHGVESRNAPPLEMRRRRRRPRAGNASRWRRMQMSRREVLRRFTAGIHQRSKGPTNAIEGRWRSWWTSLHGRQSSLHLSLSLPRRSIERRRVDSVTSLSPNRWSGCLWAASIRNESRFVPHGKACLIYVIMRQWKPATCLCETVSGAHWLERKNDVTSNQSDQVGG